MNIKNQFGNCDLPIIQKKFIEQFDGSLTTIIAFNKLHAVLNPTFSYHYHYVAGGDFNESKGDFNEILTTRDTDGSSTAWGGQTKMAEHNAYLLARALKELLQQQQLYMLDYNNNYVPYAPTGLSSRKKLFVKIEGDFKRIAGLTSRNLNY